MKPDYNAFTAEYTGNFLDLRFLPENIKTQLTEYYLFLLNKYSTNRNKESSFLKTARELRTPMPKDFIFDRDQANER